MSSWQKIKGAEAYDKFMRKYPVKSYKKGTLIFSEGDVPKQCMVIKSGIVRAYVLTRDGELKPVGLHLAGDVFPVGWTFERARIALYFYDAFVDTKLYIVPREDYLNFIYSNHEALLYRFRRMTDKYMAAMMRIGALEYSRASEKILHIMHYLCLYYGIDLKPNVVQIQLPFTQQELGEMLGLTRETTGIELKKMERSGVITRKNSKFLVRTDKLNDLLDVEYELRRAENGQVEIVGI